MAQGQGYKKCPKCNKSVWVGATTCKFCQVDIPRKGPVKTKAAAVKGKPGRPKKTVETVPVVTPIVPDPYTETTLVRQGLKSLSMKNPLTGKRKAIKFVRSAIAPAPNIQVKADEVMLYVRTLTDVPTLEFPNDVAVVTA